MVLSIIVITISPGVRETTCTARIPIGPKIIYSMGTFTNDVRTEGGGIGPKADTVIKLSKGGCVNLRTRGRGVSKNPKNLRTSYVYGPYEDLPSFRARTREVAPGPFEQVNITP